MTHRSITGWRGPPPTSGGRELRRHSFPLGHEETFPAPLKETAWRIGSNANRVFEVWGSQKAQDGPGSESRSRSGLGETLLGLAKISLGAFASFEEAIEIGFGSDGRGLGGPLAVATDGGPVPVMDPFSGRAVGELRVFLAMGTPSAIAASRAARVVRGGGGDAAGEALVGGGGPTEGGLHRPGADTKGGREEEEREKEEGQASGGWAEWEGGGGAGGSLGELSARQDGPELGDSVEGATWVTAPVDERRHVCHTSSCF